MTDVPFGSQDSQAAWTALGNRMRRNRRWLLSALLVLGLYMGTQAWLQLRSDVPGGNDGLTSVAAKVEPAEPPAISSPSPAPEGQIVIPSRENVAGRASSPASPAQAARARSQHIVTGRRAAPPRESLTPSGRSSASRSAALTLLESPRAVPTTSGPAAGRADMARSAPRPTGDPAGRHGTAEAALFAEAGGLVGRELVRWSGEANEACGTGLRNIASAVIRVARRTQPLGTVAPGTVATSKPAPTQRAASVVASPNDTHPTGPPQAAIESPRPRVSQSGLVIANPGDNGGSVHYLVNGEEHTLRPGESQHLPPGRWLLEFDRGGEFGDQSYTVVGGSYRFQATARGWELVGVQ
jgi:hypothetical protein